jgi:hypothetical protein
MMSVSTWSTNVGMHVSSRGIPVSGIQEISLLLETLMLFPVQRGISFPRTGVFPMRLSCQCSAKPH